MEHLADVLVGKGRQGDEAHLAVLARKDSVGNQAVEVHIEVQRAAEPLHEGDGPRARRPRSTFPGPAALVGEDCSQRKVQGAGNQHRLAREQKPRSAGQRQPMLRAA